MEEGYYSFTYAGPYGSGLGMLVLDRGRVVGADLVGGTYRGTYARREATGELDFEIVVDSPAGTWLVQNGHRLGEAMSYTVKGTLTADGRTPLSLTTPFGPIEIVVRKIGDLGD